MGDATLKCRLSFSSIFPSEAVLYSNTVYGGKKSEFLLQNSGKSTFLLVIVSQTYEVIGDFSLQREQRPVCQRVDNYRWGGLSYQSNMHKSTLN